MSQNAKLHPSVIKAYRRMAERGEITPDPLQEGVAVALDRLSTALIDRDRAVAAKSGALGWLLGRRPRPAPPKGLYIHGSVGRGKTMLMDLFFELLPVSRKRRAHFNDFMTDVHDRIARHRHGVKDGTAKGDDPIPPVASAIAREAHILCFDEFTVTDIADAMVLSRLFSALFADGVVLVATSNVAPDDLYRDGLNRGLFLPFVETLKAHADVVPLDGPQDYRMRRLERLPVFVTPDDDDASGVVDEIWEAARAGLAEKPAELTVMGRTLGFPRTAGRALRTTFASLCAEPLAARDYLAIAERFDMILLEHVPVLAEGQRNEAKRFILLVDTLYDRGIRLAMSAAAAPDALYTATRGTEAFEFRRTVSRLTEMQGREWRERSLAMRRIPAENSPSARQFG